MTERSYTTSFTVDQTPVEIFAAINNVRGWWSQDIEGGSENVGEVFDYHFQDLHRCSIEIKAQVAGRKVVWHVLDNYFSFTKDSAEWKGTDIIFDIDREGSRTRLSFTHVGLVPDDECYEACSEGWHIYVNGSLRDLIVTGRGRPNVGEAITDSEQALAV